MKQLFALLLLLLALAADACAEQPLRARFFDVGKADAALIETPSGHAILIDAATNKAGKALAKALKKEGLQKIDLMIITHYDKDHVGGADHFLETFSVEEVVMPLYHKESKQYSQFIEALAASGASARQLAAGETADYSFGETQLRLSAAQRTDYGEDEENDFSIAARLRYGRTRFLFPGDAENARLRELMKEGDVACDVLKTPYHGRMQAASAEFVAMAQPRIAFIPDSDEEPADDAMIQLLAMAGAEVYSARNGGITTLSDGEKVVIGE